MAFLSLLRNRCLGSRTNKLVISASSVAVGLFAACGPGIAQMTVHSSNLLFDPFLGITLNRKANLHGTFLNSNGKYLNIIVQRLPDTHTGPNIEAPGV